MADPAAAVQRYFRGLPMKVKRQVAGVIKEQADGLAEAIRAAAPKKTGALAGSVQVRRGRNSLELVVVAGGAATTKVVRKGSGVSYDYALGVEFGNSHVGERPFFYTTYRARADGIRQAIEDGVAEALKNA
jgi:hypothetical protein